VPGEIATPIAGNLENSAILCPGCCYNLTGLRDGECPEYGQTFTYAGLRRYQLSRWRDRLTRSFWLLFFLAPIGNALICVILAIMLAAINVTSRSIAEPFIPIAVSIITATAVACILSDMLAVHWRLKHHRRMTAMQKARRTVGLTFAQWVIAVIAALSGCSCMTWLLFGVI